MGKNNTESSPGRARGSWAIAAGFAALLGGGCVTPATEVMVRVYSDLGPQLDGLRVEVGRVANGGQTAFTFAQTVPVNPNASPLGTLGVTPADLGDARPLDVRVTAHLTTGQSMVREFIVHFEPERTLVLDVIFTVRCTGPNAPVCPTGTTCGPMGCESIDQTTLPEFNPDAGPDVVFVDTGTDAGIDVPEPVDVADVPDVIDAVDAADVPDVIDVPDVPDVIDVPDVVDVIDVPDVPDVVDVVDVPDVIDVPDVMDIPDVVDVVDVPPPMDIAPPPDVMDVPVVPDIVDVPIDVEITDAAVGAPRPIAPLSTTTVTSQTPSLRWVLASQSDGARVEICRDRACTVVTQTFDATGSSGAPSTLLAPGAWFWRVRGRSGNMVGAATSPVWEFFVTAHSASVQTAHGSVPDFNGDGIADVAAGEPGASRNAGAVKVYYGSATGPQPTGATVITPSFGTNGQFGAAVASAGDVNGDGFGDLVVGAPLLTSGDGAAAVYLGGPTGLATTPVVTYAGGMGARSQFGTAVSTAGDVNGDGYADLAIGASQLTNKTGAVYLYLGTAAGSAIMPTLTLPGPDGTNAQFGAALASGDLNGDGLSDLLVGAPLVVTHTGRVHVYLGDASALLVGSTLINGPAGTNADFGTAVAVADVTGDGLADVVVGAPTVASSAGMVYLFAGDTRGAVLSAPVATRMSVTGASARFGASVATGGDVDGDGYIDVVVGAPGGANPNPTGHAYVYFGDPSGLSGAAPTQLSAATPASGDAFGTAVSLPGSFDADTYADVLVGAPGISSSTGSVFEFRGRALGVDPTPQPAFSGDGTSALFGTALALYAPRGARPAGS